MADDITLNLQPNISDVDVNLSGVTQDVSVSITQVDGQTITLTPVSTDITVDITGVNQSVVVEILEDGVILDPDPTLAANSDDVGVTQKAIKSYVDSNITASTKTWIDYVVGYSSPPVFLDTISAGDVYRYYYNSDTLIFYRLVPTTTGIDSFYSNYSSGILSDLIISKEQTFS